MRFHTFAILSCLLPCGSLALAAQSTFDSTNEGWRIVSFTDTSANNYAIVGTYTPTFNATGGNPGGYISTTDPDGGDFSFAAPASFLGPYPGALNGTLSYDLTNAATINYQSADVILTGGSLVARLVYIPLTPFVPSSSFQTVNVALAAGAGWHVNSTTGPTPTTAEFQDVLSNLTGLYIRGEYSFGSEAAGLDNVNLTIVPTPSVLGAAALLSGGLLIPRRRR